MTLLGVMLTVYSCDDNAIGTASIMNFNAYCSGNDDDGDGHGNGNAELTADQQGR